MKRAEKTDDVIMLSSHCPNLVKIVCNTNFCHALNDFCNIDVTKS